MPNENLVRKATPLEAAKSTLKVAMDVAPITSDLAFTAACATTLYHVIEHLEQMEKDIAGTPMIHSGSLLKLCPIPGCGAPPEEMEGKVRCSSNKCEFSELVTKVLWQSFARPRQPVELREAIASVQHEIWAHWMKHLFSCCGETDFKLPEDLSEPTAPPRESVIPADKEKRWQRQIETPYAELSEKEKDSDREQADKVLAVLRDSGEGVLKPFYEALEEADRLYAQLAAVDEALAEGESDTENEQPILRSEKIRSIKARRKELWEEVLQLRGELGDQ